MSAGVTPDTRNPRTGPARALLEIDHTAYPDAASAIRAALANCPRYECRHCGRGRYGNRQNCKNCGGRDFERVGHGGGG